MDGKVTPGLGMKKEYGKSPRKGLINGLGKIENERSAPAKNTKGVKIIAVAVLCFLVLGVFAMLTYQSQQRNTIAIDGNFDDWQGVAKQSKDRMNGVPENIDIAEYASTESGRNVAFYAKVYGNMLYGDGRYIVEVPNENPVYVAEIREKAIPNANGRDVAYVFIDTDNNANTGFKPSEKFAVGADKAIEILGKNGKIEASRVLEFAGTVPYEWNWVVRQSVDAATNGKQMETMASKSVLGIGEKYAVYFYMVDWQGKECKVGSALKSDGSVISNLGAHEKYVPLTAYHTITIDADLSDWQSDENMSGRDNANWYLTWNETTIFVGVARGETFHGSTDDYDVIWVYMDTTAGGTTTSVDWSGTHTLPFNAEWCFILRPLNKYWNLRHWDGSAWQADMSYNGGEPAQDWTNGIAEIAIPKADIGNPTALNITFYFTNGYNNWLFGASPRENPSGASPQTLISYWIEGTLDNATAPNLAKKYVPLIHINGDSEMSTWAANWSWAGDGSQGSPYIIDGYYIDAMGGKWGLFIENTSAYIVIQNCQITNQTNTGSPSSAIVLRNVTHAAVLNNVLSNCVYGIRLDTWSTNNMVIGNTVYPTQRGIYPYQANYTLIANNTVIGGSTAGIYLNTANYAEVKNNTVSGSYNGTQVYSSQNCTIMYNNISNSGNFGMYIFSSSKNNLIAYNNFSNNAKYAINITSGPGNIVHHNNFWQNNGSAKGTTDGNSQAYDSGTGNIWYDNSANEGNYWSNWDGSSPYPIAGSANAQDAYPLASPVVPELSPLAVIAFALGLLGIALRKRK